MNVDRLQAMVQILQDVQARDEKQKHSHFFIGSWVRDHEFGPAPVVTCNTVACAFGWMALSERGKADGIVFEQWENDVRLFPYYNGEYGYEAAAAYFEIPNGTARDLFGEYSYGEPVKVKPQNVIDRINHLLLVDVESFNEDSYRRRLPGAVARAETV